METDQLLRTMHRLPSHERYRIGSLVEEWARNQINAYLKKYKWEPTTLYEDRTKKQDWKAKFNNKVLYAQFKSRNTGNDILVSIYQPYYGFEKENCLARDMIGQDIDYYITYPRNSNKIYISSANNIKNICYDLIDEWTSKKCPLPFYSTIFRDRDPNKSKQNNPCCQLRLKTEEGEGIKKGEQKVLAFLPPHLVPSFICEVNDNDLKSFMENQI